MNRTLTTIALAVTGVVGCHDRGAAKPTAPNDSFLSRPDTVSMDVDQVKVSPKVKQVLIVLESRVDSFNRAYGDQVGGWSSEEAVRTAESASSILDAINEMFDKPVFEPLGGRQTPSRLGLMMPRDASSLDQASAWFTLSYLSEGYHEVDFVINDEGEAVVVRSRFDYSSEYDNW